MSICLILPQLLDFTVFCPIILNMEEEMSWKDRSNQFIENLGIGIKVATTIFTMALAYETAIYTAEPVARAVAIPILRSLTNESEPVNPEYMPLHAQIERAVKAAEGQGIHVTYNRMPDSAKLSDFVPTASLIAKHSLAEIVRGDPFDGGYFKYLTFSVNHDFLPKSLDERITMYGSTLDTFNIVHVEGSGFARRNTPIADLRQLKEFVDRSVAENNNQPIEPWRVLTYWLGVNKGNLNESFHDTALSLEAMAMNDISSDDLGASTMNWDKVESRNVEYYATHFVDPFNLFGPYQETIARHGINPGNPNVDPLQRIRLYGEWIEAANLDMFDPSEVMGMRVLQDWAAHRGYGVEKVISSEVNAMDLYRLDQYLHSLPSN